VGGEETVVALYDYTAKETAELSIKKNETLVLLDAKNIWWKVRNSNFKIGLVPSNYLRRDKGKGESLVNRIDSTRGEGKTVPYAEGGGEPQNPGPISNYKPPADGGDGTHTNEEYVSKFNYDATKDDELTLRKGMRIIVIQKEPDGWWFGKDAERPGKPGYFPSNYVEKSNSVPQSSLNASHSSVVPPPPSDYCISVVRSLYAFNSGNSEELAFEQDEMLDIIEHPPNDPEWWLARNSEGKTGLVPINYVEVVEGAAPANGADNLHATNVSITLSLLNNDMLPRHWYFGQVKRADAERRLEEKATNGEFLVRDSETSSGDYSISMKMPGRIRHFKVVSLPNGVYGIGQRKFDSMDALLEHYKSAPIYTSKEQGKVYLSNPMA
uniref:Cytoplasmic protein n=1 Tax=Ciona savignyi TaxID=51511 RepID=H2Y7C8_CIOSA